MAIKFEDQKAEKPAKGAASDAKARLERGAQEPTEAGSALSPDKTGAGEKKGRRGSK